MDNPEKAKAELGWVAAYGIEPMMEDTWQKHNPEGAGA